MFVEISSRSRGTAGEKRWKGGLTASSAQNVRLVVAFTETGGTLGYSKTVSLQESLLSRDEMLQKARLNRKIDESLECMPHASVVSVGHFFARRSCSRQPSSFLRRDQYCDMTGWILIVSSPLSTTQIGKCWCYGGMRNSSLVTGGRGHRFLLSSSLLFNPSPGVASVGYTYSFCRCCGGGSMDD